MHPIPKRIFDIWLRFSNIIDVRKPLKKFLNKYQREIFVLIILVILGLIFVSVQTLINVNSIINDKYPTPSINFISLLPSVAAIISTFFLYLAFRQSVLAYRLKETEAKFEYWVEKIKQIEPLAMDEINIAHFPSMRRENLKQEIGLVNIHTNISNHYDYTNIGKMLVDYHSNSVFSEYIYTAKDQYTNVINEISDYLYGYLHFMLSKTSLFETISKSELNEKNKQILYQRLFDVFADYRDVSFLFNQELFPILTFLECKPLTDKLDEAITKYMND